MVRIQQSPLILNQYAQEKWQDIKHPNDFLEFFTNNPELGTLVYDTQTRPRVIHAIAHNHNSYYKGLLLNTISCTPIEFEIIPAIFPHIINTLPVIADRYPKTKTINELSEDDDDSSNTSNESSISDNINSPTYSWNKMKKKHHPPHQNELHDSTPPHHLSRPPHRLPTPSSSQHSNRLRHHIPKHR
jgi:hypothetical protein